MEENRNRKKKLCCRGWFCNKNISSQWVPSGNSTQTTPPVTTPPTDSTPLPPLILVTDDPQVEEETTSNCTVAEGDNRLKPCVGPGSLPVPSDPNPFGVTLNPIGTATIPSSSPTGSTGSPTVSFLCYCNTCGDGHICQSFYGCGTKYEYGILGNILSNRFCLDDTFLENCGVTPGYVCCLADMCNSPPVTTTVTPNETTEPITMATTTDPCDNKTKKGL